MKNSNNNKKINKIMSEPEAVSMFLKDGDTFTTGGFLFTRSTESVFREIARQGQKNLNYIDETCGFGLDILIGKGAINRIDKSFVHLQLGGGVSATPDLMRIISDEGQKSITACNQWPKNEKESDNSLKMVDWTILMITMRFVAGAMQVPFMPIRTAQGTDVVNFNDEIKLVNDPYENIPTVLVPASNPDVAFITVHRADQRGNGQVFGHHGNDDWKAKAAKHVVLFAEELVPTEKLKEYPANTIIPSYQTDAVVVAPYTSHPFAVFGKYETDNLFLNNTFGQCLSPEGRKDWLEKWVYGCKDHQEYCEKVGWENLEVISRRERKVNPLNI